MPPFTLLGTVTYALLVAVWVIPPGEEPLLGEMLGRGVRVASCEWRGASIDHAEVRATYACGDTHEPVAVTLQHPDVPGAPRARSAKFAVYTDTNTPAATALATALAERLREHERSWRWQSAGGDAAIVARTSTGRSIPLWLKIAGALGLLLLASALLDRVRGMRRRRVAQPAAPPTEP